MIVLLGWDFCKDYYIWEVSGPVLDALEGTLYIFIESFYRNKATGRGIIGSGIIFEPGFKISFIFY